MGNQMLDQIFGIITPESDPEEQDKEAISPPSEAAVMDTQEKRRPTREYRELNSAELTYAENPYRPYDGDDFQALVDDIAVNGVLEPIIVRDLEDGSPLRILAGCNRNRANIAAGIEQIPAIVVRNITDDEAKIITVGTNRLTRDEDKLLPSERAFAYKMLLDAERALRREAKRAGRSLGDNIGEILGEKGNTSRAMFYRYVSLTNLEKELLDMVDEGKIPVKAGAYLSQLDKKSQNQVLLVLQANDEANVDERKSARLLELAEEDILTATKIENILVGKREGRKGKMPVSKISLNDAILTELYAGETKKNIAVKVEAAVIFKEKTLPDLFSKYDVQVQDEEMEEVLDILEEALDQYYEMKGVPQYQKLEPKKETPPEDIEDDEHL